jgi:hypothetical protein
VLKKIDMKVEGKLFGKGKDGGREGQKSDREG